MDQDHGNDQTLKLADKVTYETGGLCAEIMRLSHEGNLGLPDVTYLIATLAATALHFLGGLTSRQFYDLGKEGLTNGNDEMTFDLSAVTTKESILFAAMLANKVCPDHGAKDSGSYKASFSPAIILQAMEAYEKLTGNKPDQYINPGMASAARDVGSMGAELLRALQAAHRDFPNTSRSLN